MKPINQKIFTMMSSCGGSLSRSPACNNVVANAFGAYRLGLEELHVIVASDVPGDPRETWSPQDVATYRWRWNPSIIVTNWRSPRGRLNE